MDWLEKIFPFSFKSADKDNFIKALIIYTVVIVAATVTTTIFGGIGFGIGKIIRVISYLADLYATGGIVFAILVFVKVFKV